jgi:hypothetical protein
MFIVVVVVLNFRICKAVSQVKGGDWGLLQQSPAARTALHLRLLYLRVRVVALCGV